MMALCTDGSLVTMCRRFDDERMRLASELVAEQAKLEHLALHDPLTGLANRALFKQALEETLAQAHGTGGVGVLFADLDNFKSVNDTLGHDAGDRLLIEVADRLRGAVALERHGRPARRRRVRDPAAADSPKPNRT